AVGALAAGIPVLAERALGYLAPQAPRVCVTGTNGKSTTTDLVGALIRATGREVEVCGNIGRAICEVAERVGPTGLLVTEVSSFQLETVQRLKPFIATWLNLTPDHLDRHGDLERYGAVKQRLFARQDEGDYAVWNADDPEVTRRRTGLAEPLEFSGLRAVGAGAHAHGSDIVLAWRGGRGGLIAGGRDKGQDFRPARALALAKVKAAVLIGEGADAIARAWDGVPVERAPTLAEAVRRAFGAARPAGTVLLSPGCASFDMFRDY